MCKTFPSYNVIVTLHPIGYNNTMYVVNIKKI